MVHNCVVRGCGSSWCPGSDLKFHAFPNNSTRRNLWLSIIPLKAKFYKSARICNLHFQESDYDSTTRRLKQTAVPTIVTNQETQAPGKTESLLDDESMVQIADVTVPRTSSGICERNSPLMEHDESKVPIAAVYILPSTSSGICERKSPVSSEYHVPVKMDKGIQVEIKSAREKILQKEKRILKQKLARQIKKNRDMSSLLASLKKYLRQSEIENIIQGRFAHISKKLKKPQSKLHGIRYSEEVKAFALTLYSYSPKAYEFLRKYITLPHVETIQRSLS